MAARKGLFSAALKTVAAIQTKAIPNAKPSPVDRGRYRAAWRARKTDYGAIVENLVPYAGPIEYGVRAGNVKPGRAMITAIAEWAKRKGIGRTLKTSKKNKVVNFSDGFGSKAGKAKVIQHNTKWVKATDSQALSIAWAIVKSMQKKGIFHRGHGLKIFASIVPSIPDFIRAEVGAELKKAFGLWSPQHWRLVHRSETSIPRPLLPALPWPLMAERWPLGDCVTTCVPSSFISPAHPHER